MVFLGLEKPVEYGAQQIFDPTMANMVLQTQQQYNNAARQEFYRGLQDIKDFSKEYGDFITPILADQDWYNKNVTGRVRDFINSAYERGIDLTRSPEGRAAISQLINSIDVGTVAKLRTRAENAKEFYKNMGTLRSKGLFDEDFSRYLGEMPDQWDINNPGISSPTEYQTLKQATNDWYDNRTARSATAEEMKDLGLDPKYAWDLFTNDDLMNIARDNTPGWRGSSVAKYYRHLAEQQVASRGLPYTQDDVEKQLQRNIASAQQEWLIGPQKKGADEFALDDYRTANDIRAHRAKAAIDYEYKHKDDKDPGVDEESGYSLLKDIYVTTLANGAGIEYLPKDGVDVNQLSSLLNEAKKRQKAALVSGAGFSAATGQFISTDKINGVIPSIAANGRGYFLSPEAILNLRTEDAVRTSVEGWVQRGKPADSDAIKSYRNRKSNEIANALSKLNGTVHDKKQYNVKVVSTVDRNGNNVYSTVGDDGRWHTYARVKVYLSNGKETRDATLVEAKGKEKQVKIPKDGIELLLPIGLQSNEHKASPDLSLSQRERVGIKPFNTVKKWIGKEGNEDFPWGTNLIKDETSLQK